MSGTNNISKERIGVGFNASYSSRGVSLNEKIFFPGYWRGGKGDWRWPSVVFCEQARANRR